jgi:hypothetical protein
MEMYVPRITLSCSSLIDQESFQAELNPLSFKTFHFLSDVRPQRAGITLTGHWIIRYSPTTPITVAYRLAPYLTYIHPFI